MRDNTKIPAGLQATGWIVGGILALAAFNNLGEWLVFRAFRGHDTAFKVIGVALLLSTGLCAWISPSRPSWLSRNALIWIGALCAFFGLLLLLPFHGQYEIGDP